MKRNTWFVASGLFLVALAAVAHAAPAKKTAASKATPAATPQVLNVEFFEALDAQQISAKLIAKNDHAARLIITNNTQQPLTLKMPEAFAGVPVAAQFGGAGGGGRGGGGGGRATTGGGGGGQQSVGGGLGGGGGGVGGGGGGGGGGFFSVAAERTEKLDFPVLCLDHGKRDPSSSAPYKIVSADSIDRPAVVELLKAFGQGGLTHNGAQAAAWHLNSGLSWNELASKLDGTRRSFRRSPYFSADEIRAGMSYATAATRLAEANADEYARAKKEKAEKAKKKDSSDESSRTETYAKEPAKSDAKEPEKTDAEKPAKTDAAEKADDTSAATDEDK